jgi:peptidoglycan hydrolase-like protein with peptidoglycan-binding domain
MARAGAVVRVDGDFGSRTEAALRRYQEERRLPVTGIGDDATRAALGMA